MERLPSDQFASSSAAEAIPEVVIDVSDVPVSDKMLNDLPYKEAVEAFLAAALSPPSASPTQAAQATKLESCSRYHGRLLSPSSVNPALRAVHFAFMGHYPLILSPDAIWLLIIQGFAAHVNANSEMLRSQFVKHEGRVPLEVRRDDFIKGSPENPWPEVFDAFSQKIREHIGPTTHDLLTPRFSTTGPVERAASDVVLLDAMQSYFEYHFTSLCGIPQIILQGTPDDWRQLQSRARDLAKFALTWWIACVNPILEEFVRAAEGTPHRPFWQSIYRYHSKSGGDVITGWISAFFPYTKKGQRNPAIGGLVDDVEALLTASHANERRPTNSSSDPFQFASGVSRAAFFWHYLVDTFEMEFLGGFLGVRQDRETMRLAPEIGWAVRECA